MTQSPNPESSAICAMQCLKCHFTLISYFKIKGKKKKKEGEKETGTMPTFLLSQFCTCPIASISGTCTWMHFCEWLCYKASEAQEIIKYWGFYSHIWLWCICWGMASKPSVIWNVWMWFALTLVCEGITKHIFSLRHVTYHWTRASIH